MKDKKMMFQQKLSSIHLCRKILVVFLCLSLLPISSAQSANPENKNSSDLSIDDFLPQIPGVDNQVFLTGEAINAVPAGIEKALQIKSAQAKLAPGWVKNLRSKTVASYFKNIQDKTPEWQDAQTRLIEDTTKLYEYFESDNRVDVELYKNFVSKKLIKFIKSLTEEKMTTTIRHKKLAEPIAQWTLESLVAREQIAYLTKFPNFTKNTLNLIGGSHFKGATIITGFLAMSAATVWGAWHFAHVAPVTFAAGLGTFIGGTLWGAFKAGPLAGPLNALLDSFFGPTNQFVAKIASTHLSGVRLKVNSFYDRFNTAPPPEGVDTKKNDSPNFPSREVDGMDFAGMTREEHAENWEYCKQMFNETENTFGQLLRGSQHAGRSLMMIAWSDEQITTILVETMDSKLLAFSMQADSVLSLYKIFISSDSSLNNDEKMAKINNLEDNYFEFQELYTKKWLDLSLDDDDISQIEKEIQIRYEFLAQRISKRDMDKLIDIQEKRKEATRTMFTALTLNELRSQMLPEANRNLAEKARRAQREIRKGFQLQAYVDKYQNHIQELSQKMGWKNAIKLKDARPAACSDLF